MTYKEKKGKINNFFSPVKGNRGFLIKPFFSGCFYSFFAILTVEVFKKATTLIQNYDAAGVKKLIIIYVVIVCIFIAFNYIVRNTSTSMKYRGTQLIQKKIFPEFFKLDNTSVEKLGTGKLQYLMNDGINLRQGLFKKLCEKIPDLIITSIYVLYQLYLTGGIKFLLIFLVIFGIIFTLINFFRRNVYQKGLKRMILWPSIEDNL